MNSRDSAQQYLSLHENSPPRARQPPPQPPLGLACSIWAPQPQPSDAGWPRALDSFSRAANLQPSSMPVTAAPAQSAAAASGAVIRRENALGPGASFSGTQPTLPRDVGAIGDGRKRIDPTNSVLDDARVEQLLRHLDLISPGPPEPKLVFDDSETVRCQGAPDFSPASVSTALLTPSDMSPSASFRDPKQFDTLPIAPVHASHRYSDPCSPSRIVPRDAPYVSQVGAQNLSSPQGHRGGYPFQQPYVEQSPARTLYRSSPTTPVRPTVFNTPTPPRRLDMPGGLVGTPGYPHPGPFGNVSPVQDWVRHVDRHAPDYTPAGQSPPFNSFSGSPPTSPGSVQHEPINFLSLLHPSSSPAYPVFVSRIIKSSDQQASIFLQQKLKVADAPERSKILDAICARGFEMMAHRFGNWAVQRCLEAAATEDERLRIVACMRGRVVELATNCYGCHVLQKALDCEESIRLLIVSEILQGDPAQTLTNKHASHVWSKIMELTWTPPAPRIFEFVNASLKGKWASLACHETGSLVVQHAFENLEDHAKEDIVDELLNKGTAVFSEVIKNQWGAYCIQHILEHGSERHRQIVLDHLITGLLEYVNNEQGSKSALKAFKEGVKETKDRIMRRMCEPARGGRRPMIVDLALSATGSKFIGEVLQDADKAQRDGLYDCIKGHIVTLRGCKTGSKVIWLFDRMVRLQPAKHRALLTRL